MSATDRTTDTAAMAASVGAFAMIANQVGGKAVRDALFLSTFGVEALPTMLVMAALFSVLTALFASRLLTRYGPGRAAPVACAVSGVTFLVIWPFVWISPAGASLALYLQLSAGGSVLISWFWSVVNERFDPRTARRRIARIAGGGTLGGIAGGLLAERTAAFETVPGSAIVPLLALLHVACAVALRRVQSGAPTARPSSRREESEGWQAGFRTIRREPYLRQLAVLVLVTTVAAALVDFLFKSQATARFDDTGLLLRFFALFYTATAILTFVVQSTVTRRLLEAIGLARTASILPLAVGAGSVSLLVPGLLGVWTTALIRGSESILRSSVFRSSYELFYTPVSRRDKRAAKTLVDVGFERLGDAIGGGVIQLLLFVVALLAVGTGAGPARPALLLMAGLAVVLGLAGLVLARRLDRGYVTALERSLLERAVEIDPENVEDQTTRSAILQTIGGMNVAETLARLGTGEGHRPDRTATTERQPSRSPAITDPVVARIAELRSRDPGRVRRALTGRMDRASVPHAIRLLGWDEVAETVIRALRPDCDRNVGQLCDALLDPDEDFVIRRRVPRILAGGRGDRVVAGLVDGLDDPRFEVRFQCSAALASVRDRHGEVQLSRNRILEAVRREAAVDRRVRESHRLLDRIESGEDAPFVDEVLRERSNRSLEHVFNMLSLVFPKEPLQIAYRGLHTDDEKLRGTALEYLESILPQAVRENLWPLLEDGGTRRPESRSEDDVLASLLESHDSIRINLETLRARHRAQGPEKP